MQKLLNDQNTDAELYSLNRKVYTEVANNRRLRRNSNYNNYISSQYPIYPKATLADLENLKQKLISANNKNFSNLRIEKIQEIQSKIDNNDYCVEGSPEWTTRQEFLAFASNFVWPDANEIVIRQQEEAELLALLN